LTAVFGKRIHLTRVGVFGFVQAQGERSVTKTMIRLAVAASIFGCTALGAQNGGPTSAATRGQLTVDATASVSPVSPTLYGLMTEEINYSYDGGIYAEMVNNREFSGRGPRFAHWLPVMKGDAQATIDSDSSGPDAGPSAALPTSMRLTIMAASAASEAGVANTGYWGMAVQPRTTYSGSFYAKAQGVGAAHARLISDDTGAVLASATIPVNDGDWQRYAYTMKTGDLRASLANHLEITFAHPGTISLQLVSLFPPTYLNGANGNRSDLMELLAAMHPHFLRLPGGNYLEGDTIAERFDWKKTIGPLLDRPTHRSPWNYISSDGMGLLEYLEWCEDLKIEPVLAVYAGYSLKGEHVEPGLDLEPYVQDALDEIEYVTGGADSKWGAERAKDGHAAAFPLHYIEIGNEDWFDKSGSYDQRFTQFAAAIRQKYGAQFKLIATTPVKSAAPDVVDDHYYKSPEEMFALVHKYDSVDRRGPKIFVGEWATRTGSPTPDFGAALGDAAWMTGLERNSDLIVMASYAPLFVNVNPGGMQWATDLIGYDALHAYGSPSYYAQALFGGHIGDHTVQSAASGVNPRFFWSATVSTPAKILHLKLVNASDAAQALTIDLKGAMPGAATIYTLHAATRWATNTIDHPDAVRPVISKVAITATAWKHDVAGNTIEVIDVPLR
jgi:alpha-N-arabinofuranosidase